MFKWIKRLLLLLLLVCAAIIGITFTSENSGSMPLVFLGYQLPTLTIGLWMVIALFLGAMIGLLLSFLPLLFSRHSVSSKNKKIQQLEKEIDALRVSAAKG